MTKKGKEKKKLKEGESDVKHLLCGNYIVSLHVMSTKLIRDHQ